MKCDLVVPVVPIAVPVSSEAGDEELRDSKNVCDCPDKMKGDTTPMRVLLVVDSSTGYLGRVTSVESCQIDLHG